MTANCWLDKGGEPGTYPSGGPVSRMYEVWQYGAPALTYIRPIFMFMISVTFVTSIPAAVNL